MLTIVYGRTGSLYILFLSAGKSAVPRCKFSKEAIVIVF